jgi:hypothetical protein
MLAMPRPDIEGPLGVQRFHFGSSHMHRVTGERVPYEVDLLHSAESTVYAARILLGTNWCALEEGAIAGPDPNTRALLATQSVLTQIDRLDLAALHSG